MIEVPDRKGSPVSSSSRATVVRTERPAAPRSTGIFLLIAAVLGLAAAFELILSELQVLRDPLGELACDINPLITCSTSLLSGQSRLLFDIPNSLIGIMAFTALATFAVIIISRVNLPRWVWWCMGAGTLVGVTYVAFFLHVSISVFQGLCPQEPYQPFGSCDAKLATSDDVQNMSMWARYGRADGVAFDAEEHFRQHPQWAWQRGYLPSRPSQPWTYFDNGNTQTQTRGALLNPGS